MKPILALIILSAVFAQCTPARIALEDDGWDSGETYTVSGKKGLFAKERMQFGPYATTSVKRSWTKGSGSRYGMSSGIPGSNDYVNIISMDYIRRRQTVRFSMKDKDGNVSDVYCVAKFNARDLTIGNRPNSILNIATDIGELFSGNASSTYYVQLYNEQEEQPWEMLVDNVQSQMQRKSYKGYLTYSNDRYYSIHPVYKMQGKDGQPASTLLGTVGFEFRNKSGKPVAAVSLIDKGMVYLQPLPAAEKFLLANACAALLMQEAIDN